MKRAVAGMCLGAVLLMGGCSADTAGEPKAAAAAESTKQQQVAPVAVPSLSPPNAEQAKALLEVNQMIADITRQAVERPKAERMTPEEIKAMVLARVQELTAAKE